MNIFTSANSKFQDFSFEELVEMVRSISRTKSKSRENVWKEGYGLASMDDLEAHVDDILDELADRIRRSWCLKRINWNFKNNSLDLPKSFLNVYNLTASQLNYMLYKDQFSIGSVENDGNEEIYIKEGPIRYLMKSTGNIVVEEFK